VYIHQATCSVRALHS